MLEHLVTEDQLAARLGVTKYATRYWRHRGQGPSWTKLGGRIFYDLRKVEEWIASNERIPQRAAS